MKVVNDIEHAAGKGNCSVLLALDMSVVFDAVDHSVLCKCAQVEFVVNGTVLDWLQSFVTDRSQYIAIGDERSETANLSSGVPQGSILGPILLALYVSPIDDVICSRAIKYHQYADDIMLYITLATNRFYVLSSLTECSDAVLEWFL